MKVWAAGPVTMCHGSAVLNPDRLGPFVLNLSKL